MIPRRRIDPEVLVRRARFQKRVHTATWLAAAVLLGASLILPWVPESVGAWWLLAVLALLLLAIQVHSLRKLAPHHELAHPPDPLEGRSRKTVDFDKTWSEA